jgi:hypothetical protein
MKTTGWSDKMNRFKEWVNREHIQNALRLPWKSHDLKNEAFYLGVAIWVGSISAIGPAWIYSVGILIYIVSVHKVDYFVIPASALRARGPMGWRQE